MSNQDQARKNIINRLRTIQGHISGIEKMIEDGKGCDEVLLQIGAIKSSIHKVGLVIMEEHAMECLMTPSGDEQTDKSKMEHVIKTIINYSK